MKIVRFTAENIKKLVAVEITPTGNVVKISGKNKAGKTSILDAIFWALGGSKDIQEQPVRHGETKGKIVLDLDDYIVERRFTPSGSTLLVTSKDGAKYPSPQKMLDGLIGRLSFDPLRFMHMDARTQFEELRTIVDLPVDIDSLDRERKTSFDARTSANRTERDLASQIAAITLPSDCPTQEVDASDILTKIDAGAETNRKNQAIRDNYNETKNKYVAQTIAVERLEVELEAARDALRELLIKGKVAGESLADLVDVDVVALRDQLKNVENTNRLARESIKLGELRAKHKSALNESKQFTAKIESIDTAKRNALAEAIFPLPGLSFADGQVIYNGFPLNQASGAEQLSVSLAIAMAANPTLRVIRITDASLLDSDSMAVIESLATDKDYQVWMECVDESGQVGIYIEDGYVAKDNTVSAA